MFFFRLPLDLSRGDHHYFPLHCHNSMHTHTAGTSLLCTLPTNAPTPCMQDYPDPFLCPTAVLFSMARCCSIKRNVNRSYFCGSWLLTYSLLLLPIYGKCCQMKWVHLFQGLETCILTTHASLSLSLSLSLTHTHIREMKLGILPCQKLITLFS